MELPRFKRFEKEIKKWEEELRKEGVNGFIFGGTLAKDRKTGIKELADITQSFN